MLSLADHLSWLMKTWKKRTLCGSTLLLFVCVLIMRADSTSGNTSVYTQERCQHRMRGIITLFSCSVLKEKQNNCRRGSSQPLHRNRCKRCSIHHVCEVSYCFYILPKHPNLFFFLLFCFCPLQMAWLPSGHFSRRSSATRILSFGWPARSTKKSRAQPSLCLKLTRSSMNSLIFRHRERCVCVWLGLMSSSILLILHCQKPFT